MSKRPNFILFITDQQRFDYLGCNGHPVLKTPNIDEMASQGISYERFYVSSPVCMPNRASLMTCRMPSSHGVRSLGIPLSKRNVTFVEILRAAGYETALIGKSHLQNVTDWPTQFEPPLYRKNFMSPPNELKQAIRPDLDQNEYQYEQQSFWNKERAKVPTPYYGFDYYNSVLRHGANSGGDYELWLKRFRPEVLELRGSINQLPHNYSCPQAIRTKIPEDCYSTRYIADRASEWIKSRKSDDRPFFLMVSFPDPHHPFSPPGKYWNMYKPEEMPVPNAFEANDWEAPEYVRIAERARSKDKSLGQKSGYSIAVSKKEAQEARALTCGMVTMIDDAIGAVRKALSGGTFLNNTVQIFTSDHGDHLGDHKLLFKGAEQYDSITHVPFIWADPEGPESKRTEDLAQTHDIGTTILERANIEAADGMQGKILSFAGGQPRDSAFIEYENQRPQEAFGKAPRVHTIIHDRWRLSFYKGHCKNELFDLKNDPFELYNLWDDEQHSTIKCMLLEKLVDSQIRSINTVPRPTAQG